MTLPPKTAYNVPIDPRLLLSPRISDEAARVGVALQVFFVQRDGRRKPSPTVEAMAGALAWSQKQVIACLDELAGLGIISTPIEGWDFIGEPVIGGLEIAKALDVEDVPPKPVKLDCRPFFCPELLPEGARLWSIVSLRKSEAIEILTARLGWDDDDVDSVARGLVDHGLVTVTVGPAGMSIKAHAVPDAGLACVEFTSEELGKVGDARSSKSLESVRKELAEKKRRAASRSR